MLEPYEPGSPVYIGPYHLLGFLGGGGFGEVHAAHHELDRQNLVAVKFLRADRITGKDDSPRRFAIEIEAIEKVKGKYFPKFLDRDLKADRPWFATELVRGLSVMDLVRMCGRVLDEAAVWQLGYDLSCALLLLNQAEEKVLHRDLAPNNVMVGPEWPMVVDFGLAKFTERPPSHGSSFAAIGNPRFAPPEQILHPLSVASLAGVATDVFMLGATLLYAATGHAPRNTSGDNREEVLRKAREENPDLSGLPSGPLYSLVSKCLLRSIENRPTVEYIKSQCDLRRPRDRTFAELLPPAAISELASFSNRLDGRVHSCEECSRIRAEHDTRATLGAGARLVEHPVRIPSVIAKSGWTRQLTETLPEAVAPDNLEYQEHFVGIAVSAPDLELPSARAKSAGTTLWTAEFPDWVQATPALINDMLVVAAIDGTAAALDAATGDIRWALRLGASVRSAAVPLADPPAGLVEQICIGDAEGVVYAVSLRSHEVRRMLYANAAIEGSPMVVRTSVLAVAADAGIYRADSFMPGSGRKIFQADASSLGPPAVSPDSLYTGSSEGQLLAVDVQKGRLRWWLPTVGRVCGAPLLEAGNLYITATDGLVREVDLNGRQLAAADLEAPAYVTPAISQGRLYAGSADGTIRAFDLSAQQRPSLAELWPRPAMVSGEIRGMAVHDDCLYVAAEDHVHVLDALTGTERPGYSMDSTISTAPVVQEGRIYLTGLGGTIRCISLS